MSAALNLIMVPGLLCDAELWAHQTQFLADIADCRVATVTNAGTVEKMAAAVLADAPERFALAGLSMGGHSFSAPGGDRRMRPLVGHGAAAGCLCAAAPLASLRLIRAPNTRAN